MTGRKLSFYAVFIAAYHDFLDNQCGQDFFFESIKDCKKKGSSPPNSEIQLLTESKL